MVKTNTTYVAVLFTAEYGPPCLNFLQPFQDFIAEANKDAANPKFQVLVVNCDKSEEQYKEHLGKLKDDWYAVPFEHV